MTGGRHTQVSFDFCLGVAEVRAITHGEAHDLVVSYHYSKRFPSGAVYLYGKYVEGQLVGVCVFGSPASPWVSVSATGERNRVLELQRLALINNEPNEATWLIARSLRLLRREWTGMVVSYADTAQGHHGGVYQAAGFFYAGKSDARTDIYAGGKHPRHHNGDSTVRQPRSAKHRYWIYVPRNLKNGPSLWPKLPYPKPDAPQ